MEIQERNHLRLEMGEKKRVCVCMTGNMYIINLSSCAPNEREPWGVHVRLSKLRHQPGLKSQTLSSPV